MKLLLFSDVHCKMGLIQKLVEQAKHSDIDVVVGAGDFGYFRQGLDRAIQPLKAITKPTVLIPGNCETEEELRTACHDWPAATILHGTQTNILGVDFFGLGGGIPVTPFGPQSYDFTESEAEQMLKDCPSSGVLVCHSPPHGVLDVSSMGLTLGSRAIRRAIEARNLHLVVCGHIHESSGKQDFLGQTPVINAGPFGFEWEISSLE